MTPGTVVGPGQSVTTGPNASVRLRYPDGSTVDLNAVDQLDLVKGARQNGSTLSRAPRTLTCHRSLRVHR